MATSKHLHIKTSPHQNISTSKHLHIKTSSHQNISTSKHLHIKTSPHQNISTSKHHHIKTSSHQNIFTSKHLHIKTWLHCYISSQGKVEKSGKRIAFLKFSRKCTFFNYFGMFVWRVRKMGVALRFKINFIYERTTIPCCPIR